MRTRKKYNWFQKKKKMLLLTNKVLESYQDAIECYICRKSFIKNFAKVNRNHLPEIDFQNFKNLYKKCTAKPYYFLVIDCALVSSR